MQMIYRAEVVYIYNEHTTEKNTLTGSMVMVQ